MTNCIVIGGSGLLGSHVAAHLHQIKRNVTATFAVHPLTNKSVSSIHMDVLNTDACLRQLSVIEPDLIVYCTGITDVDFCEQKTELSFQIHAQAAERFADYCNAHDTRFVYISTDHLWDGTQAFVGEQQETRPINAYAQSKAAGEELVLDRNPSTLVVRTNFFGRGMPWRKTLSDWIISKCVSGEGLDGFIDSYFTPLHVNHLAELIVELVDRDATGVYHVASRDKLSKYDFALRLCKKLAASPDLIRPAKLADANLVARRPLDMSLSTDKISRFLARPMPSVDDGIGALDLNPTGLKPSIS